MMSTYRRQFKQPPDMAHLPLNVLLLCTHVRAGSTQPGRQVCVRVRVLLEAQAMQVDVHRAVLVAEVVGWCKVPALP